MLDRDGIQPNTVTFICPLREAFYFLYGQLSAYDLDPEYTFSFLGMLVDDVMEQEQSRAPVGGSWDEVIAEMGHGGMDPEFAKKFAYAAGDLIIHLVSQQIPNIGSALYKNAYEYYLSPTYDLYVSIQRSVFESYESDRIPPTGPRAYRL